MSLVLTDMFTINGKPMFAPDAGVKVSWADLDSEESGRDQAGNMHRVVIKYDVGTWSFEYQRITEAELAYMRSIFPKEPDFVFGHPAPEDRTQTVTVRAYRAKHSITWQNAKTGEFRNYTFNIIESSDDETEEAISV